MSRNRPVIGVVQINYDRVTVYGDPKDNNASYSLTHRQIIIGLDDDWDGVMENVIHEVQEYFLHSRGLMYSPQQTRNSFQRRKFIIDHDDFAEMCGTCAEAYNTIEPKLIKMYEEYRRK